MKNSTLRFTALVAAVIGLSSVSQAAGTPPGRPDKIRTHIQWVFCRHRRSRISLPTFPDRKH